MRSALCFNPRAPTVLPASIRNEELKVPERELNYEYQKHSDPRSQRVGIQAACLALLLTVVMIAMISGVAGAALAAAGWFLTH